MTEGASTRDLVRSLHKLGQQFGRFAQLAGRLRKVPTSSTVREVREMVDELRSLVHELAASLDDLASELGIDKEN